MKTYGKLNLEIVSTKAVTTKPQMEHEKKQMHLIKDKERLKKENKGGEKTNSSNNKFDFVNKKAVQKTAMMILKNINWLAGTMILKKINWLMEMRMSTLKKL